MANAGPQGNARILEHHYRYEVSDEWIQERIDEDGIEPPKVWNITFELRELPDIETRRKAQRLRNVWESIPGRMELHAPTDDPALFLELVEHWVLLKAEDARDAEVAELKERESKLTEQEMFEAGMEQWISDHGSKRLKLARAGNYKVVSTYAKERGRADLPGCWIDTAERAEFRERVDPSMEALQVESTMREWLEFHELDLETRIIWLVGPPSSMVEHLEAVEEDYFLLNDFRQQEALLIPGFLGRYHAFYLLDPDERAPVESSDDQEDED